MSEDPFLEYIRQSRIPPAREEHSPPPVPHPVVQYETTFSRHFRGLVLEQGWHRKFIGDIEFFSPVGGHGPWFDLPTSVCFIVHHGRT